MAKTFRRSALLLLSALGVGCGDPGTTGAFDGASTALDEATSENQRHAEVCRHAGSLSAMLDDVGRHEVAMNDLMVRMQTAGDQMRTGMMEEHACDEPGLAHMSHELTDAKTEVAEHSKQMRAATTLGAGHFECSVHAHELRNLLASMRDDLGSMTCAAR